MQMRTKLLFAVVALAGCSSSEATAPVDAGKDVAKRDAFVLPPEDAGPSYRVTGKVIDTAGKPYDGSAIQVCGKVCTVAFADSTGAWVAQGIVPEQDHLRVEGKPNDGRFWSPAVFHIVVNADLDILQPTVVPEAPAPVALTAGEKTTTVGEVSMTFDDAKLTGSTHVFSSVRVANKDWPAYDAPGKTIVAVWALLNFGAKSPTPMPVTLDVSTAGFTGGEKVTLYAVDVDSGLLTDATPATVSIDGKQATTDSGGGLLRLTWIVLAK